MSDDLNGRGNSQGPIVFIAIEPHSKGDEERMHKAFEVLQKNDGALVVKTDMETGQTNILGMDELHLRSVADRLRLEFNVVTNLGEPQPAYRETIRSKVIHEAKMSRGGRGQYAHVSLAIEPQGRAQGFKFVDESKEEQVPRKYIPAIENGFREALEAGALAGYPIVDIKVSLLGGSYHEVDSNEFSFKIAADLGLRAGCQKADPVLLWPIMNFQVTLPIEYLKGLLQDLKGRCAKIVETTDLPDCRILKGTVPIATMLGYADALRSLPFGGTEFAMEFSHFQEVPSGVREEIIARRGMKRLNS